MNPIPVDALNVTHSVCNLVPTQCSGHSSYRKSWHLWRKKKKKAELNRRGPKAKRWYYEQAVGQSLSALDNPKQILWKMPQSILDRLMICVHKCVHKSSSSPLGCPDNRDSDGFLALQHRMSFISHDHRLPCTSLRWTVLVSSQCL